MIASSPSGIWKKGQVENSVLLVVAVPTVARSLCNVWTPKNRPNPTLSLRTFLSGGKNRWDWKNSAIVENMWVFFSEHWPQKLPTFLYKISFKFFTSISVGDGTCGRTDQYLI